MNLKQASTIDLLLLLTAVGLASLVILNTLTVPADAIPPTAANLAWLSVALLVAIVYIKAAVFKERLELRQATARLRDYVSPDERFESFCDAAEKMMLIIHTTGARESAIADYARDIICVLSAGFTVEAINSTSEQMLGYTPIELVGKPLSALLMDVDTGRFAKIFDDARRTLAPIRFEVRLITRAGKIVDTAWHAEWSQTNQMFFASAQDITAKKAEERARGELITMISHDVRSPLGSVLLSVEALSKGIYGPQSELASQALLRMEKNISRIVDLLTELIDLEKSVSGELNLNRTEFNIRSVIAESAEQLADLAEQVEVSIDNSADDMQVYADKKLIYRVLINLVTNAIKHSGRKSTITVSTSKREREVEIQVQDQGPGIPEHLQRAIFERFVQLDLPTRSGLPSSGLGLTICKSFIEAHNCHIGVRSEEGGGSTFWFSLPVAKSFSEQVNEN